MKKLTSHGMGEKIIHAQAIHEWESQKNYDFPQVAKKMGFHSIYSCPDPAVQAIHEWKDKGVYWSRQVCKDN